MCYLKNINALLKKLLNLNLNTFKKEHMRSQIIIIFNHDKTASANDFFPYLKGRL